MKRCNEYIVWLGGSFSNNIRIRANRFCIDGNGTLCFWIEDQLVAAYANGSWTTVKASKKE